MECVHCAYFECGYVCEAICEEKSEWRPSKKSEQIGKLKAENMALNAIKTEVSTLSVKDINTFLKFKTQLKISEKGNRRLKNKITRLSKRLALANSLIYQIMVAIKTINKTMEKTPVKNFNYMIEFIGKKIKELEEFDTNKEEEKGEK